MATKEQLERALRNADAAGDTEAAKLLAAELAKVRADSYMPQPGSALQRFGRGVGEGILGIQQLGANLASNGSPSAQNVAAATNQQVQDYAAESAAMAPEGLDIARMLGNATVAAPLGVGGGELVLAGRAIPTALRLASAGATSGGIAGLVAPVTGEDYATEKMQQVALGAGGGAVLTPVAAKALGALTQSVGNALRGAKNLMTGKNSVDEIRQDITMILNQQGIDTSQVGPAYVDELAKQVKAARDMGGDLDADALANKAAAKALGLPELTRGQATQDAAQYQKEIALRSAPGGEELATQYQQSIGGLGRSVAGLAQGKPAPVLDYEAGGQAIAALKQADAPAKQTIDRLYNAARESAGVNTPLDGRTFADKTFAELEKQLVVSDVPSDITQALNMVSTGKGQLTIGRGQEILQAINQRLANLPNRDPQRVALGIVKRNLDDAINTTGEAAGDEAAKLFRQARTAAAVRLKRFENIPLLRKAIDDEITPDEFIGKLLRTPQEEFKATRAYLRSNNRQAWDQVRAQVVEKMRASALSNSDNPEAFSHTAFAKELNSLRRTGKLGLLFSESEIKTLNAIDRVGRAVQKGPPGVSRTGLAGSMQALGMLTNLLSKVGGPAGALADTAVKRGSITLQSKMAQASTAAAPGVLRPAVDPKLINAAALGLPPLTLLPQE